MKEEVPADLEFIRYSEENNERKEKYIPRFKKQITLDR